MIGINDMTVSSEGTCEGCRDAANGGPDRKSLEKIGNTVQTEVKVGRGIDRTDHSFFQCNHCGSVWVKLEDSGAGCHGRFWRRLTEGLF